MQQTGLDLNDEDAINLAKSLEFETCGITNLDLACNVFLKICSPENHSGDLVILISGVVAVVVIFCWLDGMQQTIQSQTMELWR